MTYELHISLLSAAIVSPKVTSNADTVFLAILFAGH